VGRSLPSLHLRAGSGRRGCLALATCSLLLARWIRVRSFRAGESSASILSVVVHSLHVVEQVVPPRETVARKATLTSGVEAEMRSVTVTVHAVGLTFVAE
jgi:hypothetical protein